MTAFFTWQHAILKADLEATTKHVCLTIGCHMAMDGTGCFPSYQTIADECGLSRRAVIEHVKKAAEAGYLTVDSRERDNGSASSNLYQPNMPGGEPAALGGERGSLGGGERGSPLLTPHISNTPINNPPISPSKKAPRNATGRRLEQYLAGIGRDSTAPGIPADFATYARALGWDAFRIGDVWEEFCDYWASPDAKNPVKRDWFGAWRNWCRRAAKWEVRSPSAAGKAGGSNQGGDVMAAARRNVLADTFGIQPDIEREENVAALVRGLNNFEAAYREVIMGSAPSVQASEPRKVSGSAASPVRELSLWDEE